MKVIRDSIHKDIYFDENILEIIDTEEFQRLRNVKQLGLANLIYPSANHTRFEHSLGTMFLSEKMAEKLELDKDLCKIAGLLHDIGHPPFSHTLEIFNYNHEKIGKKIIKKLNIPNFSSKEIVRVISGKVLESNIISGDVDADRMDYLLRDSYHTGTAYGLIDIPRILRSLTIIEFGGKKRIGILNKGIQAIESLLVARHQMYSAVYMHKTVRIANTMLKRAVSYEILNKNLKIGELSKMDDVDLISFLRNRENYIMKLLDKRILYKRKFFFQYYDLSPKERWLFINLDDNHVLQIENKLKEIYGFDIFIDIFPIPKIEEHNVFVLLNNKVEKIDSISPLSESLNLAEKKLWKVSIYVPKENIREIEKEKIKKLIFDEIESNINSELYRILKEFKEIEGKGRFLEIAKDCGITTKEFYNELYKLVFCGLINEKFYKNKYIYSLG